MQHVASACIYAWDFFQLHWSRLHMRQPDLFPFILLAWTAGLLGLVRAGLFCFAVQPVLNLTLSAPRGLYVVRAVERASIRHGMLVRLDVPAAFASYVYGRGWLAAGTPLLKTVAGMPGDVFCVAAGRFAINNRDMGAVREVDSQGLALPAIRGCSTVPPGHFLAVSTFHPGSFDGR